MTDRPAKKFAVSWRRALGGALVCVSLGLLSWSFWYSLVFLSYDLLFLFGKTPQIRDLTIIYMDGASFAELRQTNTPSWDRRIHAQLLDRLTADGAKVVAFDIIFDAPMDRDVDRVFADSIRKNGHVILGAAKEFQARRQISSSGTILPIDTLLEAAAGWGIAKVAEQPGEIVRHYSPGTAETPTLAGAAVALAEPQRRFNHDEDKWLRYYGPSLSLPNKSYVEALDLSKTPPGYFRGHAVFIGARPETLRAYDQADVFRTPYSLWGERLFPGVEINATAFLNALRNDGLIQLGASQQVGMIVLFGFLVGGGACFLRPGLALLGAFSAAAFWLLVAMFFANQEVWLAWTVPVMVQVPAALGWAAYSHFYRLGFEKTVLEETLAATTRLSPTGAGDVIQIPDHTLLRCVGKGAYGEVWLARNVIGSYHAVKLVKRDAFPSDEPYEREFRGMQRFMPISRGHPGLVNVLHVGRNDAARFFFYIMEASDDVRTGQRIDPEKYLPKTLAWLLAERGQLTPPEVLSLGLSLSLALEHLHRQGLIHRDIKPANIIYVNDVPKFADIGLVTEIAATGQEVSELGTKGYVPPEGPGRASADVYALGKVLYEAALGRDRLLFPEVPTSLLEQSDEELLKKLHRVISRTCATDLTERYTSAEALHAALRQLESGLSGASAKACS